MKPDGTALTAGFHSPCPFRLQSHRRQATADWSSTNWGQIWSCRSFTQCNSPDLNRATPIVTERGHNLYKPETREIRIRWGLTTKCLYNPSLISNILTYILCISQLSPLAAPRANWVTLKFSIWRQSREPASWNISWHSPHLLLPISEQQATISTSSFIQHSRHGLAKAEPNQITAHTEVQTHILFYSNSKCRLWNYNKIGFFFILDEMNTLSFLQWDWFLYNTGRNNICQGKFSYMQQLLSFMASWRNREALPRRQQLLFLYVTWRNTVTGVHVRHPLNLLWSKKGKSNNFQPNWQMGSIIYCFLILNAFNTFI